ENSGALPAGVSLTDMWSPKAGYVVLQTTGMTTPTGVSLNLPATFSYVPGGSGQNCATAAPYYADNSATATDGYQANGTAYEYWCMGVGFTELTATDVAAPPAGYEWYYSYGPDIAQITKDLRPTVPISKLGGPNNPLNGANATGQGSVIVLDPRLELDKEVCSTGVGCDPNSVAGDDAPVPDSVDNTTGQWVDSATVPQGTTQVEWRITVKNTGDIELDNVHLSADQQSTDPATGDASVVGADDCMAAGSASNIGNLQPGQSYSFSCTTPLTGDLSSTLVNQANANGSLPAGISVMQSGKSVTVPLEFPDGTPVSNRYLGNAGEAGMVPSNNDAAEVSMPNPGIGLTKWVCTTGTNCAVPTGTTLAKLAGTAQTPGAAAGGWVKETTVAYDTAAEWLIVVTNTGNTNLAPVTLASDVVQGSGHGDTTGCTTGDVVAKSLAPGQSAAVTCTTAAITNTEPFVVGPEVGDDVVNQAQATGTPVTVGGAPIVLNGQTMADVVSSTDRAEVRAEPKGTPVPAAAAPVSSTPFRIVETGGTVIANGGIGLLSGVVAAVALLAGLAVIGVRWRILKRR
ncbi:MAG: hypothetical protein FWF28_08155, partial [Micrococcales bacterium]|nr:hypothetical protein [Micrococcales bacterium]